MPGLLPKEALTPAYCRNGDEFNKLFYVAVRNSLDEGGEDEIVSDIMFLRVLLHDYLALCLSGELVPYVIDEEEISNNSEGFKELINYINCHLAEMGIPLREGDKGNVEIDYEALCKMEGHGTEAVNYTKRRGHEHKTLEEDDKESL